MVYGAWPKCVLRDCENACGCPGVFGASRGSRSAAFEVHLACSQCVLGGCETQVAVLGPLDYCRSAVVVHWAWPKRVLRGCENARGCPGLFGALRGSRSAVVVHLACSKCVLGGCENTCGRLRSLEPWTTVGLLSWFMGHGPNAF